jgi:hypothetical protein
MQQKCQNPCGSVGSEHERLPKMLKCIVIFEVTRNKLKSSCSLRRQARDGEEALGLKQDRGQITADEAVVQ